MSNYNLPESARLAFISALDESLLDRKLRIAGMSLSYDHENQILLVHDSNNHACLVDTTLVLDSMLSQPGLRESKTVVQIIGYLERVENSLPIPTVPAFVEAPEIDPTLVIRAILISPTPELDLDMWELTIRKVDEADEDSEEELQCDASDSKN